MRSAIVALVAVSGCTSLSVNDLTTTGITANMSVTADGTGQTQASALLTVGTSIDTFVDLSGSTAKLTATVGSQTQTLSENMLLGATSYTTTFTGEDATGTQYTLSLNRADGGVSAPDSTCTIPPPFTLETPDGGVNFSRASDAVVVSWTPTASDPVNVTLTGDCIAAFTQTVQSDTGTLAVSKGTLVPASANTSNCQVTATVTRSQAGTLDTDFGGGSITGQQTRTATFLSTP